MSEKWKRRSTSTRVDVDLDDFDTDQLLQALIDARAISEDEAVRIKKRRTVQAAGESASVFDSEPDEVDMAWTEIQRGRKSEALCHIERALGREWIGRLS